ncbi:uncharacterized protein LOC142633038 [Castanea sativa]|uniref:uncharacterized protein LOC142633038 n=1 Tax=Castanea sativa TaxID=21020 RepID=UPI003F64FD74
MSALAWNCRGLGNPCTVTQLQKVMLEEDPSLVFLMETKFDVEEMARIKRKLERQQGLVVPCVNRGGGLALLWKSSLKVDIQTYYPRHIDIVITEAEGSLQWRFTGFYGEPVTGKRGESWRLLEHLSGCLNLPWVVIGDFNEIMFAGEKLGGNPRPECQMHQFREVLNKCHLRDLGYIGSDFTWSRRWGSQGWIRERLDRAFVSTSWASVFPQQRLHHVAAFTSNHCMLLLKCPQTSWRRKRKPKLFRAALTHWNKSTFGHVGRKISTLRKKLQVLENIGGPGVDIEEVHETKVELNKMLLIEEEMWNQRSGNCWLKAGDKNTSFFHTKASNRHQRNTIQKVMSRVGVWQEDEEFIGRTFVEYYENLFTSSRPVVSGEMLDAIHTKVTDRMNEILLQDFRAPEVERALKQMHPLKALGLDGMPPLFYQHFWPNVSPVVIQTVLEFLNNGVAPPKFHETHIVLISKTRSPATISDYRPISLCNVAYKLASKTIANRLKGCSERKRKGKYGEMALKLDMSKAYDRVEWDCLQLIMRKLGFHERWIQLVMRCVSPVTYAIRVNGVPCGAIRPTRGLRQGDPLSRYLFILVAEGLSALIHRAVQNRTLKGLVASVRGPKVSHLFFTNDNLIFSWATTMECQEIQRILHVYEAS